VPVLAKGQTITGRLWTYVRDDRPAHSGDLERSIRSIMNTDSGDHEHPLALA
jgi:hypothetical protein